MLDNMPLEMMREAVAIAKGAVLLEASGGVSKETVVAIAETGVDIISHWRADPLRPGAGHQPGIRKGVSVPIEPRFRHFETVGSTNDIALDLARDGEPEGLVITATASFQGRGRRGRTWHDEPGQAIIMSVILRPAIPASEMPKLSFVASLAVDEWLGVGVRTNLRIEVAQ